MRALCSCESAMRLDVTGTFKYSKTDLVRQGYDPVRPPTPSTSTIRNQQAFVPLDKELYDRIQTGGIQHSALVTSAG